MSSGFDTQLAAAPPTSPFTQVEASACSRLTEEVALRGDYALASFLGSAPAKVDFAQNPPSLMEQFEKAKALKLFCGAKTQFDNNGELAALVFEPAGKADKLSSIL
jgi:hypothetical protein